MHYQPIENHGIVGNMHSAALVGLDGSVDWLCLPRFDSPSVFAAILDADKGGRFRIAPNTLGESKRGRHSQSTDPSMPTRAALCMFPTMPWFSIGW